MRNVLCREPWETYTYYNMDQIIEQALAAVARETGEAE